MEEADIGMTAEIYVRCDFTFVAPSNLLDKLARYESKVVACNLATYESKVVACNLATAKKDGLGMTLDIAGFIPGEKLLGTAGGVVTMVGIGVVSTVNSAVHGDLPGSAAGIAGTVLPAVAPAAKYAGVSALESIPALGTLVNVFVSGRDAVNGIKDYEKCMAEP